MLARGRIFSKRVDRYFACVFLGVKIFIHSCLTRASLVGFVSVSRRKKKDTSKYDAWLACQKSIVAAEDFPS